MTDTHITTDELVFIEAYFHQKATPLSVSVTRVPLDFFQEKRKRQDLIILYQISLKYMPILKMAERLITPQTSS